MKTNHRYLRAALAMTALAGSFLAPVPRSVAGEESPEAKMSKPLSEEPIESKIHVLLNLDLSNAYITPRGLNVNNKGLIIQPLGVLLFDLYSSKGWLSDVTMNLAVWNCLQTYERNTGPRPGPWNEIDFSGGLTVKILKNIQLDAAYTSFTSETQAYPTSTNLDLKLTYHDNFVPGFSLNPYYEYFQEVTNKATVDLDPTTSRRSFYFVLGMDPTIAVKIPFPVTIELPTFANFCGEHFYQQFGGAGGGSGFALISTELKATVPLSFIPKGYGNWSFYAGCQYYYLQNHGLLDGNLALEPGELRHNLVQVHTGLTIFF